MRLAVVIALLGICAAAGLSALAALLILAKPIDVAPPDDSVVAVGGLQYEAMLGRPIQPSNVVDAPIVAGLAPADRRVPPGQLLFGAFLAVANDSPQPLPAASHIELRDAGGRVYRRLALPASNAFAYEATPIPPKTRIPGFGTPADDDLAATGKLVLFRITTRSYHAGPLELLIHDARDPRNLVDLEV